MPASKWANDIVMDNGLAAAATAGLAGVATHMQVYDETKGGDSKTWAGLQQNKVTDSKTLGGAIVGPDSGGSSGRRITLPQESGIDVTVDGTAEGVALTNGTDTVYYNVDISNPQGVAVGNKIDLTTWEIQLNDPTP